jgi:ATP-dependent Clp protease ATP-binding subunit ClpA
MSEYMEKFAISLLVGLPDMYGIMKKADKQREST